MLWAFPHFGALGHILDGSGGLEILTEVGVLAPGSLNGMLLGKHYNAKPVEIFLENDQRPELWLILGPKWPLWPISYTLAKIAQMSLYIKCQVNPVETFQENKTKTYL